MFSSSIFSILKTFLTFLKRLSNQFNPKSFEDGIQLVIGSPRRDFYKQGKKTLDRYRGLWEGVWEEMVFYSGGVLDTRPLLAKLANLSHHWPSQVSRTLME